MDYLKEDARKLHRHLKRVEGLVSDLHPYYEQQQNAADPATASQALAGLHNVQAVLAEVQGMLESACSRGKLSTYLQADRLLQQFQGAIADLDAAVAALPCNEQMLGSAYDETVDQVGTLRAALQRVKFQLPEQHAQQLQRYRVACDSLQQPLQQLQTSCKDILRQVCGHTSLAKDEFAAAVADLQHEVRQLQASNGSNSCPLTRKVSARQSYKLPGSSLAAAGTDNLLSAASSSADADCIAGHAVKADLAFVSAAPHGAAALPTADGMATTLELVAHKGTSSPVNNRQEQQQQHDEYYLRLMCDLLRVTHQQDEVPLEFTCPITTCIMTDPMIIHETGHSYEHDAIEDWFNAGHRICPKTGTALKRLNISPNHALKAAIRTWNEANDLQLQFRPLLRNQAEATSLLTPAFGAPRDSDGQQLPATMTNGRLDSILGGMNGALNSQDSNISSSSHTGQLPVAMETLPVSNAVVGDVA
eukprot:GHRR01020284.1.p1 GENE.GHRR01020284.1~~GHRR01020284.1.p1  ORF type:complete len:476 (+),score=221.78 GHRR01020284.1:157-1584(+)